MAFQRAQWHSGLTYQQVCPVCKTTVSYTDEQLDFRPWYADGYVDCPVCKKHMRHSEKYAINAPQSPAPAETNATADAPAKFCTHCGAPFEEGGHFCASCGAKRP